MARIKDESAPCPRCGTELSMADEGPAAGTATPEEPPPPAPPPPAPPPAAMLPAEDAGAENVVAEDAVTDDVVADDVVAADAEDAEDAGAEDADDADADAAVADDDVADDAPGVSPPAATRLDDVEPEPQTSVRPPDLRADRDPLEGWDESPAMSPPRDQPDPAVIAAGAGVGLLLGLLLGGRGHRGLGALLGAALGAVVAGLRG